jgi:hypothetical protein
MLDGSQPGCTSFAMAMTDCGNSAAARVWKKDRRIMAVEISAFQHLSDSVFTTRGGTNAGVASENSDFFDGRLN